MRSEEYKRESTEALRLIPIIRYIDKFRKAIMYENYSNIRQSLIFVRLHYKNELRRRLDNREALRTTGELEEYKDISDDDVRWIQFDGVSYGELTYCANARIKSIKECRRFLEDKDLCNLHPLMEEYVTRLLNVAIEELHSLRKMRPILRRSGERLWINEHHNFKRDKVPQLDLLEEYEKVMNVKRGNKVEK